MPDSWAMYINNSQLNIASNQLFYIDIEHKCNKKPAHDIYGTASIEHFIMKVSNKSTC